MAKSTRRRGSASPKAERQPVVVTEVLDRASDLFFRRGFNRTRMQDIAAEFGVTHAALYYHFDSKNDILAQVNIREITALTDNAAAVVAEQGSPIENFFQLIEHHLRYVARNPANAATLFDNDYEMPADELAEVVSLRRKYTHILADLYKRGVEDGQLVDIDPMVAVSLILGACNWIYRWYRPDRRLSVNDLVSQAMRLLENMAVRAGEGSWRELA